ncbi:MAG: site-2 protease family protein [Victivallales bacterium]|nr:site-2 protease family protein [Victivallales bacterium]
MNILTNIGIIIFIVFFFGFCIFIHEFGHLLAAVWQKLHVDKFSIGFGKKIWGFKYKGIDFIISLLPLGGYVSIPQLDPTDKPKTEDGRELPFSNPKARAITAFAGPFFNILFGFVLAIFLWIFGAWQTPPTSSCIITDVPFVQPVYGGDNGLNPGERITHINGHSTKDIQLTNGLNTGEFDGELYDLCVFWNQFPREFNLPTVDGETLKLTVVSNEDDGTEKTRDVDYIVHFNAEYAAGLRMGDRITAFNGDTFKDGIKGVMERHAYNDKDKATVTVKREGQKPFDISYVQAQNSRVEDLKVPFFQARDPLTIGDILPASPAETAGLQRGDQFLAYDDKPMLSINGFLEYAKSLQKPTMTILYARKGTEYTTQINVPEDRADLSAAKLGMAFIVTIKSVFQGTPAEAIGLKAYDRLIKLNGVEVIDGKSFSDTVKAQKGKPLTLTVLRDGEELTFKDVKAEFMSNGKPVYLLGIQLDDVTPKIIGYPTPWEQFTEVFNKTAKTLWLLFQPVTNLITGREGNASVKLKHMSSFVGISAMLWYTVKTEGIRGGLAFIILITFGLAFANLLPFPILDGGHIMFAGIEALIRRRLPAKFMSVISNIFAGLLIALMLFITYNDIRRLPKIKKAYSNDNPKLVIDNSTPPSSDEKPTESEMQPPAKETP